VFGFWFGFGFGFGFVFVFVVVFEFVVGYVDSLAVVVAVWFAVVVAVEFVSAVIPTSRKVRGKLK
jgi:hypothetical protein